MARKRDSSRLRRVVFLGCKEGGEPGTEDVGGGVVADPSDLRGSSLPELSVMEPVQVPSNGNSDLIPKKS
ncbi:hypothetical protein E2562_030517, partial [Oryza meyeriana var. granulata]